jgi:hypothetical protein
MVELHFLFGRFPKVFGKISKVFHLQFLYNPRPIFIHDVVTGTTSKIFTYVPYFILFNSVTQVFEEKKHSKSQEKNSIPRHNLEQ